MEKFDKIKIDSEKQQKIFNPVNLIRDITCVGDYWHNEKIMLLLKNCDKSEKIRERTEAFCQKFLKHYNTGSNWIDWTDQELSNINTILRYFDNKKTLPNKIKRLETLGSRGCYITQMFNNSRYAKLLNYINNEMK